MFKTPQIGGSKKGTPQQRGTQSAPTTVSCHSYSHLVIAAVLARFALILCVVKFFFMKYFVA